MVGQAEVVVGPQHDPLLAVDDDDGVLRFGNRIEVRIQADGLQLTRFGELPALVEQRDLLKLLSIHGASARVEVRRGPHIAMSTEWLKLVNGPGVTQVADRAGDVGPGPGTVGAGPQGPRRRLRRPPGIA